MDLKNILHFLDNIKNVSSHKVNVRKIQGQLKKLSHYSLKENEELLMECILKYIDCIINIISHKSFKDQIKICRKSFDIITEIISEHVLNTFIKVMTKRVFDIIIEDDVQSWCIKKELLKVFINCIKNSDKNIRQRTVEELPDFYLFKLIDSISTYGDYELQLTLIEAIFRMYGKAKITLKLKDLIPESQELSQNFADISGETFDEDVRKFLNALNHVSGKAFSVTCKNVYLGNIRCEEVMENVNGLWVDFNLCDNAITWFCNKSSFDNQNIETDDVDNSSDVVWNLITLFTSDVESVQIHRPVKTEDTLILFTLKESCISSFDDNQAVVGAADNLKLVISSNSIKMPDLLSQVLPCLFKNKFQHTDSSKVSSSKKATYKPLDIKISRKVRSESSRTRSDTSLLTFLDPMGRFSRSDLNSSSREDSSIKKAISVSSASTKCEVISIPDSSTHSTGLSLELLPMKKTGHGNTQNDQNIQYEPAVMYPNLGRKTKNKVEKCSASIKPQRMENSQKTTTENSEYETAEMYLKSHNDKISRNITSENRINNTKGHSKVPVVKSNASILYSSFDEGLHSVQDDINHIQILSGRFSGSHVRYSQISKSSTLTSSTPTKLSDRGINKNHTEKVSVNKNEQYSSTDKFHTANEYSQTASHIHAKNLKGSQNCDDFDSMEVNIFKDKCALAGGEGRSVLDRKREPSPKLGKSHHTPQPSTGGNVIEISEDYEKPSQDLFTSDEEKSSQAQLDRTLSTRRKCSISKIVHADPLEAVNCSQIDSKKKWTTNNRELSIINEDSDVKNITPKSTYDSVVVSRSVYFKGKHKNDSQETKVSSSVCVKTRSKKIQVDDSAEIIKHKDDSEKENANVQVQNSDDEDQNYNKSKIIRPAKVSKPVLLESNETRPKRTRRGKATNSKQSEMEAVTSSTNLPTGINKSKGKLGKLKQTKESKENPKEPNTTFAKTEVDNNKDISPKNNDNVLSEVYQELPPATTKISKPVLTDSNEIEKEKTIQVGGLAQETEKGTVKQFNSVQIKKGKGKCGKRKNIKRIHVKDKENEEVAEESEPKLLEKISCTEASTLGRLQVAVACLEHKTDNLTGIKERVLKEMGVENNEINSRNISSQDILDRVESTRNEEVVEMVNQANSRHQAAVKECYVEVINQVNLHAQQNNATTEGTISQSTNKQEESKFDNIVRNERGNAEVSKDLIETAHGRDDGEQINNAATESTNKQKTGFDDIFIEAAHEKDDGEENKATTESINQSSNKQEETKIDDIVHNEKGNADKYDHIEIVHDEKDEQNNAITESRINQSSNKKQATKFDKILRIKKDIASKYDLIEVNKGDETAIDINQSGNQTLSTTVGRRMKRMLYNPQDFSYLQDTIMEDDTPVIPVNDHYLEEKTHSRINKQEKVKKPRKTSKVKEKSGTKRRNFSKQDRELNISKRLKIVNPNTTLKILNSNEVKKYSRLRPVFYDMLESFRREVGTSFPEIIQKNNAVEDKISKKTTKRNVRRYTKRKMKQKLLTDRTVRAEKKALSSSSSDLSLNLWKATPKDDTPYNSPHKKNPLPHREQNDQRKKINIISNVVLRPKRRMLNADTEIPEKKIKNAETQHNVNYPNEAIEPPPEERQLPVISESITNEEISSWIATGIPQYKSYGGTHYVLKHTYPMFKSLLNSGEANQEHQDVVKICSILKKYV